MSQFEELTNFVAVIELGGISAAADRFNVSKSVVSRRLKSLEERLGTQLVVRTTRRQRLTNEGQAFYERAKQILVDLEEAESSLSRQTAGLKGRLRITAPVHFGENFIAPALTDFMALHDDLVIDVDLLDRHVNLVEEVYDLAVRIGRLPDSSLIARKLCTVTVKVCASPTYFERFGMPDDPLALSKHRALFHRSGAQITEWYFQSADGERHRARPQARMISNDDRVLLRAALEGHGLICVPEFVVAEGLSHRTLIEVMPETNWMGHEAYAVYPPTRHLSHRVRACVDFLAERIS